MLGNLTSCIFCMNGIRALIAWLGHEGCIKIQPYSVKIHYSINKNCASLAKRSKTEHRRTFQV